MMIILDRDGSKGLVPLAMLREMTQSLSSHVFSPTAFITFIISNVVLTRILAASTINSNPISRKTYSSARDIIHCIKLMREYHQKSPFKVLALRSVVDLINPI